jgi:hypothetical protein
MRSQISSATAESRLLSSILAAGKARLVFDDFAKVALPKGRTRKS